MHDRATTPAVGMARTNPDATRPSRWRGLNLLGFALMDVREQLTARPAPVT